MIVETNRHPRSFLTTKKTVGGFNFTLAGIGRIVQESFVERIIVDLYILHYQISRAFCLTRLVLVHCPFLLSWYLAPRCSSSSEVSVSFSTLTSNTDSCVDLLTPSKTLLTPELAVMIPHCSADRSRLPPTRLNLTTPVMLLTRFRTPDLTPRDPCHQHLDDGRGWSIAQARVDAAGHIYSPAILALHISCTNCEPSYPR